ncbi:hypothetical protein [Mycobacterium cookii]|uniref:hypothetical protein n=1 Tax=Mycobacterium cookii TaxID=1775 RepID=UPI0021F32ACF|nr:hypothetical protein [Mycobacterium cookii]MCV7330587.1 hypothetical protein [Mycobacterium cookii]
MPSPRFHVLLVIAVVEFHGFPVARRAALHRVDPPRRLSVLSSCCAMQSPTSTPGPTTGTSGRWWCRRLTEGSLSGAEDGVDFGDQRQHH